MSDLSAVNCKNSDFVCEYDLKDLETEWAIDDFCDGLRTGCGARAARGMRWMGVLDGLNLAFLLGMFRGDSDLFTVYKLKFEPNPSVGPAALIGENCSSLAKFVAAGEIEAVSQYLEAATKIDEPDVQLIARLLESDDHNWPHVLHFVQRRPGPPVDEFAKRAKWFKIYCAYQKVYKPGMQRKQAVWLVQNHFNGQQGFGKSTIYDALRHFPKVEER